MPGNGYVTRRNNKLCVALAEDMKTAHFNMPGRLLLYRVTRITNVSSVYWHRKLRLVPLNVVPPLTVFDCHSHSRYITLVIIL